MLGTIITIGLGIALGVVIIWIISIILYVLFN